MATSMLTRWLEKAKEKGATHVVVVCDTFDWSYYPVYVMPGEDARKIADANNGPNMTKLMEVYNMFAYPNGPCDCSMSAEAGI